MEERLLAGSRPWQLMVMIAILLLAVVLASGSNHVRQGLDRVVRLVAQERMQEWARQIVRRYPDVIRTLGHRPLPETMVRALRQEAEIHGVEAFRLHSRAEPLGRVRLYASNTFESPLGQKATRVIVASAQGTAEDDNAGLVRVRVPLKDEQDRVLGHLTAVVNQDVLRRELVDVLQHLLLAAVLAIGIVVLLSFLLFRQVRSNAAAHIHYMRDHDELTGLPNQNAFEQYLERLLSEEREEGRAVLACMVCGVDNLGKITCAEGHDATGHVLRTLASRLVRIMHEHDADGQVFRLERDEFALLLPMERMDVERVQQLGLALIRDAQRPVHWRGKPLLLSVSIGVTFHPAPAQDRGEILRQATLMREAAQEAGGNALRIYDADMDRAFNEAARLERLVRRAARNCARHLGLHFQPIVHLDDGRLHGFEVLLRMRGEDGAMISPAAFIPVAERLKLMDEIGAFVLAEACAIAARWPDHLKVAVNLSPSQFESGRLPATVDRALERSGLPAQRLELEVTESIVMRDWDSVRKQLREVRKRGASVVLDDFGTGYSSMSYLWKFDFDKIKIDRSFTQAISTSQEARSILRALVLMARSLDLPVVVEGVETPEQAAILRKLRCTYGQGWLFGRPVPAEEVSAIILRDWQMRQEGQADAADPAFRAQQS